MDSNRTPANVGSNDGLGPLVTDEQVQALLAEFGWRDVDIGAYTSRKQVAFARRVAKLARESCIKACAAEQLQEEPETEGDLAYFQAVQDCIAAIRRA